MPIQRPQYQSKLLAFKDKDIIKILLGVRRSGKSTILKMFAESLVADGVTPNQIQMYNFENPTYVGLDYLQIYQQIQDKLLPDQQNYIFLDEVQNIPTFEKLVDGLFIKENVDVYITGSNAYMLSGELATFLTGRYIEIKVYPLSFAEYHAAKQGNQGSDFEYYLNHGGFPFATKINDESSYEDYVGGLVDSVLVRDVLSRKQRSDAALVENVARFLTDSAGSLITIKKISDTLTSAGRKTTSVTIEGYLKAFQEAYLFYRADRFDISGKRYLTTNAKYYPVDEGVRRALLGQKRQNIGHRLEALVYMELLRRGYRIYVGQTGDLEVDFVAERNGIKLYVQVSYTLQDESTYQREVRSLKAIDDNYQKILLTNDPGYSNDEGIEIINIQDWLLDVE